MAKTSEVFISYAHGDREFQDRILLLHDILKVNGVSVKLDRYEPNPPQGWNQWMVDGIRHSDFVLCVCTESYFQRFNGEQTPGTGLGVQWEGNVLKNLLQSEPKQAEKVQVVQLDLGQSELIPLPVRANNRFVLDEFSLNSEPFEALYRILTRQPLTPPDLGSVVELPSRSHQVAKRLEVLPPTSQATTPHNVDFQKHDALIFESSTRAENPRVKIQSKGQGNLLRRMSVAELDRAADFLSDGMFHSAITHAQKALSFSGDENSALLIQSQAYFAIDEWAKSLDLAERYIRATDDVNSVASVTAAASKYRLNPSEENRFELEKLIDEYHDPVHVSLYYANALYDSGKRQEGIDHLSSILKHSREPRVLNALAVLLWGTGDVALATTLLEEATEKGPEEPARWANLGVGRAESRRFGLAIEALRKAISINPRYQFAKFALSEIYALMGDAEAAIEPLKELVANKSHELPRLLTERTFDPIRNSDEFSEFIQSIPSNLLRS